MLCELSFVVEALRSPAPASQQFIAGRKYGSQRSMELAPGRWKRLSWLVSADSPLSVFVRTLKQPVTETELAFASI